MLLYYGITPYIVFDGGRLPSKESTEDSRAARREKSKTLGLELYKTGRVTQARQEFQKAIDVTPYMARLFIERLKSLNIQYVVAPYEADAQLVYLENHGIISGIISEDSDMLVYGAKVLISKLDKHGDCVVINRDEFTACRDISLVGWTDEQFRQMCILSGCDYLANIPKMGLKTAYNGLRKYKTVERVIKVAQFEGNMRVPPNYMFEFKRAELTFKYQRVFCPKDKKLVTLSPLSTNAPQDMTFIGDDIEPDIAVGIACGDLDPFTKKLIQLEHNVPKRARVVLSRRQTLPSDGKAKHCAMNSFFTPKRVPLGELDPNSLTPSPSQQALLLENSNRSWTTRRITMSPYSEGATPTTQVPPRPERSETESSLSRSGTPSQNLPFKRQRLCSDAAYNHPSTFTERSRFFPTDTTGRDAASRDSRTKKPKKADFGVFLDDSVESIMCPTHDSTKIAAATILHPNNVETEGTTNLSKRASSEKHTIVTVEAGGQNPGNELPRITSRRHCVREDTDVSKDVFGAIGPRFAYKSGKRIDPASDSDKTSPLQRPNSCGVARERTATSVQLDKQKRHPRITPLQRLRQTALGRSKSMNFLRTDLANSERVGLGYEPDNLPDLDPSTDPSSLLPKGSEDMIVPSTDDSDDGTLSSPGKPYTFGSLDLKKFEYSPV